MQINVSYDQSAGSLPAGFTAGISSAVIFFESQFTNPITINLHVGYGELNGSALPSKALAASQTFLSSYSYAQLRNALVSSASSSDDKTAVASLPTSDPTNGGHFFVTQTEAAALGLLSSAITINGYIGFSNTASFAYNTSNGVAAGQYDFFGAAAHEITEIMGRMLGVGQTLGGFVPNTYFPLDLFHYSAPGTRTFSGTQPGYFSPDGGTTNLGNFNTTSGGDFGDWAPSVGHDSFLAFTASGFVNPVTSSDLREMDVLGFTLGNGTTGPSLPAVPAPPTLHAPSLTKLNEPTVTGTADANDIVTIYDAAIVLGKTNASAAGTFSFTPSSALSDGTHFLAAIATDAVGQVSAVSPSVTMVIDTIAPAKPTLEAPGLTKFDEPVVDGTAEANSTVTLYDFSAALGTTKASAAGTFSFVPGTPLSDGMHTLTATATDAAGNVSSPSPTQTVLVNTALLTTQVGTNGGDVLQGTSNDIFYGGAGNDTIVGGTGINTSVYSGASTNYSITATAGGPTFTVQDKIGTDGIDTLINVQNVQFTDQTINSGLVIKAAALPAPDFVDLIELYVASFNRAPDALGLDYWASRFGDGMSLSDIARSFFVQPETTTALPSNLSNVDFVTKVYNNVLGRGPDAEGLTYWLNGLQDGSASRDTFLLSIIDGARASSGGSADAQYLANKEAVGAHFALAQGLNDIGLAKSAMANVDGTSASAMSANQMTDAYADTASTAIGSALVVKIVGIAA